MFATFVLLFIQHFEYQLHLISWQGARQVTFRPLQPYNTLDKSGDILVVKSIWQAQWRFELSYPSHSMRLKLDIMDDGTGFQIMEKNCSIIPVPVWGFEEAFDLYPHLRSITSQSPAILYGPADPVWYSPVFATLKNAFRDYQRRLDRHTSTVPQQTFPSKRSELIDFQNDKSCTNPLQKKDMRTNFLLKDRPGSQKDHERERIWLMEED